jgi:hypothetical protein
MPGTLPVRGSTVLGVAVAGFAGLAGFAAPAGFCAVVAGGGAAVGLAVPDAVPVVAGLSCCFLSPNFSNILENKLIVNPFCQLNGLDVGRIVNFCTTPTQSL